MSDPEAREDGDSPSGERSPNEELFGWRSRLHARLRGQTHPLLVFEDTIVPGASLWAGARVWVAAFRERGLRPGDRVVLALPESPAFLFVLLAALWTELTLILPPPAFSLDETVETLDAAAFVATDGASAIWTTDTSGLPVDTGNPLHPVHFSPTPEARFLLATSGTLGAPRWIALSDANLFAVIDSHAPLLGLENARVLSVLPWRHAFGLVLDLLPALLGGAEIVRAGCGGRDTDQLRMLMLRHEISHLNAVPLVIDRLARTESGAKSLQTLRGGIVGGARVRAALADFLGQTTLRVGYGQTEASPGIALGEPGVWRENYLGRPLACAVRLSDAGTLQFSGANACLGEWGMGGLMRLEANRWVDTGDIVRQESEDLFFVARADDGFKLNNGRPIQAGVWESALKQRFPQCREVLLSSPDGEALQLTVVLEPDGIMPSLAEAHDCLGRLQARLQGIQAVPLARWAFTPKGDMDRAATLQGLFATHSGAVAP